MSRLTELSVKRSVSFNGVISREKFLV